MTDPNGTPPGDGGQQGGAASGKPITAEDVAAIAANVMNSTLTARFKGFKKDMMDSVEGILGPTIKKSLDDFSATQSQQGKQSGKGSKGGKDDDQEPNPALLTMKRQLEDVTAELNKQKEAAAAATARERNTQLRSRMVDELGKIGITEPARAKFAIAHLVDSEKRVFRDDDDPEQILFRDADGSPLDLPTGLKAWAKSEEAKFFLPPTGARGSGDQRQQGAGKQQGTTEPSPTDIGLMIAREFGGIPIG